MKRSASFFIGLIALILILYLFPLPFTIKQPRTITVSGAAQEQKTNEIAQFSAGVNAVNDDKQQAVKEVNTKVSELIATIKKFGIQGKDIKTQNLNIYQNQEQYYEGGVQKQRFGQWNVSNTIEITLRNGGKANEFTDVLSKSGANNVYGPNFSLDTSKSSDTALFNSALQNAKTKAENIAKASGSKLGKVITINEGGLSGDQPILYNKGLGGGGGNAETEIGSTTVSKTVTVTFELK